MNVIAMSKLYDVRPSVLLDIPDAYTSYCFDEACAYITSRIKDGEEPDFSVVENNNIEKSRFLPDGKGKDAGNPEC